MRRTKLTKRRNNDELRNDAKRIMNVSRSSSTLQELQKKMGLSRYQILKSLTPEEFEKVKNTLQKNKENNKKKTLKSVEQWLDESGKRKYVIDASVCGWYNIENKITQMLAENKNIVLTSMTVRELEKLQNSYAKNASVASYILSLAAKFPENFETVLIKEKYSVADDNLIEYCKENRNKIILLTRDKTMALKARMYGVRTLFLDDLTTGTKGDNVRTLYNSCKVGDDLILSGLQKRYRSTRVLSNGVEYNQGTVTLHIGDDVLIAKHHDTYASFCHFRVINLNERDNCQFIYGTRVYYDHLNRMNNLNPEYRRFMKDFITRS